MPYTGYIIYHKFLDTFADSECMEHLEHTWKTFYNLAKGNPVCLPFINLFQYTQLMSYSEAICETVGSVMNLHRGHGRNVHFVNFGKEIYLRCNLAPMHILKNKFIPEIVKDLVNKHKVAYTRKGDQTIRGQTTLKSTKTSATIFNFRQNEERRFKGALFLFEWT